MEEGKLNLNILTEKEAENVDQIIYDYIQRNLSIEINKEEVQYSYIGKELAEDGVGMWCYLEVTEVKSIENIKITNNILVSTFSDQKNVMNIIGPNRKKGVFLFQKGSITASLNY
ncbi:MAG: DUF6702 family protein [Bacteroidota bacterium]